MVKKLIKFILSEIDIEDINYTYSRMCINRCTLFHENYSLYNKLDDLVHDFIIDNDLYDDWLETEVGLIEDLFDELLKEF